MDNAVTTTRRTVRIQRDQKVRRLTRKVRAALPWIQIADSAAVRAWAELEVLSQLAYQRLRESGIINDEGEPRALLDAYLRTRKAQLSFEKELGMTPRSRAEIASGSRTVPIDADFEARVTKAHNDQHAED
jgi:hypothetical protein